MLFKADCYHRSSKIVMPIFACRNVFAPHQTISQFTAIAFEVNNRHQRHCFAADQSYAPNKQHYHMDGHMKNNKKN